MYLFLFLPLSMAWGQNDTLKLEDIAYLTNPIMIRFSPRLKHDYTFYPDSVKNLPHFTDACGFFDNYKSTFPCRDIDSLIVYVNKEQAWNEANNPSTATIKKGFSYNHYINNKKVVGYRYEVMASVHFFTDEECKKNGYPKELIKGFCYILDTTIMDTMPILFNEAEALQIALDSFPTKAYLWEVPSWENKLKNRWEMKKLQMLEKGIDTALYPFPKTYYPTSEVFLKQLEKNGHYEPVYKFNIEWAQRPFGWDVYVSAHSGKIVKTRRTWSEAFPCNHSNNVMVNVPTTL